MAADDSENELLRKQIDLLQRENISLQNKVIKVERVKEVLPPNYQLDMKRLTQLESRCKKLQKCVEYGNISGLQTLIEQFMAYSRTQLKKISLEIQFVEYGAAENELLEEFVQYLDHVRDELHDLVLFQEVTLKSPVLNQCEEESTGIINELMQTKKFTNLSEAKLKELYFTLQTFRQIIQQFQEEVSESSE